MVFFEDVARPALEAPGDGGAYAGDLLAQVGHLGPHHAGVDGLLPVPGLHDDALDGDDGARARHEHLHDLELLAAEHGLRPVVLELVRGAVQRESRQSHDLGREGLAAAQHGAHARGELCHVEGLGEVVVCAGVEPVDALAHLCERGEEHDGAGEALCAGRAQHCSNGLIGLIESGKAKPSFDTLTAIAESLSVHPADLFLRDCSKSKSEIKDVIEKVLVSDIQKILDEHF